MITGCLHGVSLSFYGFMYDNVLLSMWVGHIEMQNMCHGEEGGPATGRICFCAMKYQDSEKLG